MKPGDLVLLKSGGPLMTVESVESGWIVCTWFDDKKNYQQRKFLESTLEEYDPGEGTEITIS